MSIPATGHTLCRGDRGPLSVKAAEFIKQGRKTYRFTRFFVIFYLFNQITQFKIKLQFTGTFIQS